MSGILLLIDFEKAFDTVRWTFLHKVLIKFNFGKIFKKWIQIIYNNIQSTVINNGFFSPYFNLCWGVRQGCSVSAYLFLLVVEILAICIRNNKNIQGIQLTHAKHSGGGWQLMKTLRWGGAILKKKGGAIHMHYSIYCTTGKCCPNFQIKLINV